MSRGAYYNEFDPAAAAWLRELIACGLIAPGEVDTRSITDVSADELAGFTQCHFFAGIGIWSHALRRAGWPDERPVWTGSCPCQPFSPAGKGLGFDDPRHLWPAWFRLIAQRRPDRLFGEQSAAAGAWVDLVRADLEALGYAFGSPDLPAAGFADGAHIRQRLYWVADAHDAERWADLAPRHDGDWPSTGRIQGDGQSRAGRPAGGLGDASSEQRDRRGEARRGRREPAISSAMGRVADADGRNAGAEGLQRGGEHRQQSAHGRALRIACDWIPCADGLWRPVESGTFPLAFEDPARMGRLRGYGNALDAEVAAGFIAAFLEASGQLAAVP